MTDQAAVVILNWNGKKLMEEFLPGVIRFSGNASIVVGDNGSTDGSVSWLKNTWPGVRLIINRFNEGYSQGYNTVLNQVDAKYYMLLNSDVAVTEGWLEPLINYLETHPATAVVQPKILWQRKPEYFEYSGASGGYIDKLGYPFCRGRIFDTLETDQHQYDDPAAIFWASGACMLIRSSVFKASGGFDPHFFAHMEEIDLCWRIRNMGHEIACLPRSVVYHVGGATLDKSNPHKTFLNFRNNLAMLYKNLPGTNLLIVLLSRLLLDGIAGIKFLLQGNGGDFVAVIRAHFNFYFLVASGSIRRMKGIKKHHSTIYENSIVMDYYLKKITVFSKLPFKKGQTKQE